MADRLYLLRAMIDLHRKNMENHLVLMHQMIDLVQKTPPDPKPQHIIITGPTTASALAPLPGTELTIYRTIPNARRLWDHCLATNYRFEPSSFIRLFPTCGHYFWYRHNFRMEQGVAVCPQCEAEDAIVQEEERQTEQRERIVRRRRRLPSQVLADVLGDSPQESEENVLLTPAPPPTPPRRTQPELPPIHGDSNQPPTSIYRV